MEVLGKGIIQYVSSEYLLKSQGNVLYKSFDGGKIWKLWCTLPISWLDCFWSANSWLSRLSRKEVYHVQKINNQWFYCFGFDRIFLINKNGKIKDIGPIKGSRPLRVCTDGKRIFYGVYKKNTERQPIHLYVYNITSQLWRSFYTFNEIRHIHGVFWDSYEAKLWITTGDLNTESAIIYFDHTQTPKKHVHGSQQARAVDLLFTPDSVFYATDAPHEQNYIYRFNRHNSSINRVQSVGGPVFWGRIEKKGLFFSTVVEPSKVNRTDAVELWFSREGNDWKKIKEFRKDIGSMKLFQYGQIKFPAGPGDGENIWFTPYATTHSHSICKFNINTLEF